MFLTPDWVVAKLTELPLDQLSQQGVSGFIFDLDNTLMPPKTGQVPPDLVDWLAGLEAQGFSYVVVSNNRHRSYLDKAQQTLQVPVLGPAMKPSRRMLKQGIRLLQRQPYQVAVVGDRPLTDIWGGYRVGARTVLVDPLIKDIEHGFIKFLRRMERLSVRVPR